MPSFRKDGSNNDRNSKKRYLQKTKSFHFCFWGLQWHQDLLTSRVLSWQWDNSSCRKAFRIFWYDSMLDVCVFIWLLHVPQHVALYTIILFQLSLPHALSSELFLIWVFDRLEERLGKWAPSAWLCFWELFICEFGFRRCVGDALRRRLQRTCLPSFYLVRLSKRSICSSEVYLYYGLGNLRQTIRYYLVLYILWLIYK